MSKDKIDVIYRMLSEGSSPIDVIKHFRLLRDDPNIPGKHKGVSNRTVYQVAERMKNGESIYPNSVGRPKTNEATVNRIIEDTLKHPKKTCRELGNELHISHQTVAKIRNMKGNFKWEIVKGKEKCSNGSVHDRKVFVDKALKNPNKWSKVLYSDETRIGLEADSHHCWMPCHDFSSFHRMKKQITRAEQAELYLETSVYKITVMFWAMIGNGYKSDLIVCPQRMNKDGYIEMLEKNHVFAKYRKFLKVNGQRNCIWFQQDNARPHVAATPYLKRKFKLHVIKWPAYSCDMSPIEQLRSILKSRLRRYRNRIDSEKSLIRYAKRIWRGITPQLVNRLTEGVRKRMKMIQWLKGRPTNLLNIFNKRAKEMVIDRYRRIQPNNH